MIKMETSGKIIRAKTIFRDDGKTVIVAMDQSFFFGNVSGLEDYLNTLQKVAKGGADAVLIGYGMIVKYCREIPKDLGLLMSLPMPQDPSYVQMATSVGAHGIKFTHFGSLSDTEKLKVLVPLGEECRKYGLVYLTEIVPTDEKGKTIIEDVPSAARIGAEAGADLIKTAYTGSVETFKKVTEICPVPVVILGGPKMDSDRAILETVRGMIDAGGAGVAFGRNIFQHRDPTAITRAICKIVHEDASVDDAMRELT